MDRIVWTLAVALALTVVGGGCPTDDPPADDDDVTGDDDDSPYSVPLAPDSPWPKFRANARQDGRSPVLPVVGEGEPWSFATGKGIFSTPVVAGDGTIYVGSADRFMYALNPDGSERWSLETGEIIDSSGLLDDRGRLYFGSGDGVFRAVDATTGEVEWTFEADDPSVNDAFINWFEGNVAIGPDGTLLVPNDNWFVYALDRDSGEVLWRFETPDQTWSLAAVDPESGELFFGNNNLLESLGDNLFNVHADGSAGWSGFVQGTLAASPLLTTDDQLFIGGFDGFLRAYDADNGLEQWAFGTRDHLYASPALLPDGTLIQASADGTIYALDPTDGSLVWAYDTREPIRSSPAIDANGTIHVGSGEGRLYVLNPDGTLRWAMQLIYGGRNDLNASPALGETAVYIAGESGEIFSVPHDWCLRDEAADSDHCIAGPDEDLPADGAFLLYTTPFGAAVDDPPDSIAANAALAFSLFVREAGDTVLAHLDSDSVAVEVYPAADVEVTVSGDRRFLTVTPATRLSGGDEDQVSLRITGEYLINPDREGLAFSGGEVGGSFDETFVMALDSGGVGPLPLPYPAAPGDDAGTLEMYRLAAPLPSILPSYNQIGFDSLHYLVGLVEGDAEHGVAWVVGGIPEEGSGDTVVDPSTTVVFPLEVAWNDGELTLASDAGLPLEVMNLALTFRSFRVSAMLDAGAQTTRDARVLTTTICSDITFYGPFLQTLGFCNPQTDVLLAHGTTLLRPHAGGVQSMPAGVGEVTFAVEGSAVVATVAGSTLSPAEHRIGVLLVDAASGAPVNLDYLSATSWETGGSGELTSASLDVTSLDGAHSLRVYLMVDTYPAAVATLDLE